MGDGRGQRGEGRGERGMPAVRAGWDNTLVGRYGVSDKRVKTKSQGSTTRSRAGSREGQRIERDDQHTMK